MKLFIFTHTYISVTTLSMNVITAYICIYEMSNSINESAALFFVQRQWLLSTSLCWNHKQQVKLLLIILSRTLPSPFLCPKHISSSSNTGHNRDSHYSKWAWKAMKKTFPTHRNPQLGPQPCHCSTIPVLITFWALSLNIWEPLRKLMYFADSHKR